MEKQLTKEFLEMKKVSELPWQFITECLSSQKMHQEELLKMTINHPIVKIYSPSVDYMKLFLKTFIKKIEDINIEVCEGIYKLLLDYLHKPKNDYYYRTYTIYDGLQITLHESNCLVANGTTGLTTWQASHVLVHLCIEDKLENVNISSSNILELGSGLGLTGLSIIKAVYPPSYTFSDHHHSVLEELSHNVFINLALPTEGQPEFKGNWGRSEVFIKTLDWENPGELVGYDIVLGADILFDLQLVSPLLNTIMKSLKSADSIAIIAATVRNQETIDLFSKEMGGFNLFAEQVIEKTYKNSSYESDVCVIIFCIRKHS